MQNFDRNILHALPQAIILVDNDHNIQFMNLAATTLFEVSDGDAIIGKPFSTLSGGSGFMTYEERIKNIDRINEFALSKVPMPKPDDEQRWVGGPDKKLFYFIASPIFDDNKKKSGYVVTINDQTVEQSAERFLASFASEMMRPMNMIEGYAEWLLLDGTTDNLTPDQLESITGIKEKSKEVLSLREEIFKFFDQIKSDDANT